MGNRFFLAIAVDCHRNTEFPLLYVTKMSGKVGGRYRIAPALGNEPCRAAGGQPLKIALPLYGKKQFCACYKRCL